MKKCLLCVFVLTSVFMAGCGKNGEKAYKVGKDIEAGEYVLVGTSNYTIGDATDRNYGFYQICSTKDCNIDNDEVEDIANVVGKAYVILEEGQYLNTENMKLYKVDEYKSTIKNSISYDYNFGHYSYYKVGKDLSAGTYTFTGDDFYYAVCNKPSCDAWDEMVDNAYISAEDDINSATVTLEEGQYLIVSGTEPFTAVKQ